MKYFDKLIGAHEGRPAIIICGGPSAPDQLKAVQPKLNDPVLISVNQHGDKLAKCDYAVSLDNIFPKMREVDAIKLCPYSWADYKLTGYWNSTNSGRTACWIAYRMGCTPIVVVGADLYTGGSYFWSHGEQTSGRNVKLEGHLKEWEVVKSKVPEEILVSAGGPLVDNQVLKKFDGRRKYPLVDYLPERVKKDNSPIDGHTVRIIRPCWAEGLQFWVGEEPILRERTCRQLVRAGKAEYVVVRA